MEEAINKIISDYIKENNLSLNLNKGSKKVIIKSKDIVLDVEILKEIILKAKFEKKNNLDSDYIYYVAPSCKYYITDNMYETNDLDLNYGFLLIFYHFLILK